MRLANKAPQGRSGREQSSVTDAKDPRGPRLLLTDEQREYQRAVCGSTWPGSQFVYPSRRAAWGAFHGPALGALTFGWHTKAMVGLFHVAMDDSGAGMPTQLRLLKIGNVAESPLKEGKQQESPISDLKMKNRTFKIRMRMDVSLGRAREFNSSVSVWRGTEGGGVDAHRERDHKERILTPGNKREGAYGRKSQFKA